MKYIPCVLLSFLVLGCVTEELVYNVQRDQEKYELYTVQSDSENLADVAKRFTGSASNWQLLANYNPSITSYNLKRGDVIQIPNNLLIDGENLFFNQEAAWQEKKVEISKTPEPIQEPTLEPTLEPSLEPSPEQSQEPVQEPSPSIGERDISPYELENRKILRNEILSDILSD